MRTRHIDLALRACLTLCVLVLGVIVCNPKIAKASDLSLEEARDYLTSYSDVSTNVKGQEVFAEYSFASDEDLNAVAEFVSENGIEALNAAIDDAVQKDEMILAPFKLERTVSPSDVTKYISGNGTHNVSGQSYGLADFGKYGTGEYRVVLGYRVVVSGGQMTSIDSTSFDIPSITRSCTWGNLRLPNYVRASVCGATANYDVTKTIEIPIGDASFELKSIVDNEIFTVTTYLS